MKKQIFFAIVALLLTSLACSFSGASLPEGVLFQDDFSGKGGGWDTISDDPEGITDYSNDAYRIFVDVTDTDFWGNPDTDDFSDLVVEVDAQRVGGPDINDFGVQCRYDQGGSDEEPIYNFYFFIVGSDGYAAIGKLVDNEYNYLAESSDNAAISADGVNRIEASCVGTTLTLTVNGTQLLTAQDSSFASGGVGLLAGSYEEPGTDVHFDNFVVREP